MRRLVSLWLCLTLSLVIVLVSVPYKADAHTDFKQIANSRLSTELATQPQLQQAYATSLGQENSLYHVQQIDNAHRIHNPEYGYSANFLADSVEIQAGVDTWHMQLISYGYDDQQQDVETAVLSYSANKMTYARGNLSEWYVNSSLGLQQGFTLAEAPSNAESGDLILTLNLNGTMRGAVQENTLYLTGENGTNLTYDGLYAYDANGQTLPANLHLHDNQLFIEVDDSQAIYPITIDPWVQQTPELFAAGGENLDFYGITSDIDGDTAIVGAPNENDNGVRSGAAYVYTRAGGVWSLEQRLIPTDNGGGDEFGFNVAIDGDTVIVGAVGDDDSGFARSGSAYIFVRNAGVWTEQQELAPSDPGEEEVFGYWVDIDGDSVIIGTPNDGGTNAGAAYVFVRNAGVWTLQQKLVANDIPPKLNFFGYPVVIDGDTVLVGAYNDNTSGSQSGAVYVLVRNAGVWTHQQKLTPTVSYAGHLFGSALALDGDLALIGAFGDGSNGVQSGAAFLFSRSGSTWSQGQALIPSDGAVSDEFSTALALEGNWAVISSPRDDDNGSDSGSVYLFGFNGSSWQEYTKLTASDGAMEDRFGRSVGISGNSIISGAYLGDGNVANSGSAYVFNLTVPNNDEFSSPTVLSSLPITETQSALNASLAGTDPTLWCAGDFTDSVWFSYTPSTTQAVSLNTTGSNYNAKVGVYTGTEGNLTALACGGAGDPTFVHLQTGVTYYFMVAKVGIDKIFPNRETLVLNGSAIPLNDAIVLFDPATANTSLHDSAKNNPRMDTYINTPPTNTAPEWVMGDWNGDGIKTPGYFDSGAFRYTNEIGPSATWSSGIWLGNAGSRVAVVSGRYATGFANDNGNDCIGWVDSNTSPVTGDLRFSLKYWCDMTAHSIVPLSTQFLGSPLGDSGGFSGTFQFAYGDWDNDGLDEPAVRRSDRITRSDAAPQEGGATYPAGMAQRWDTDDGDGPGAHGLDDGSFVAGDWNGDNIDTWGVVYDDDTFYYRDVFGFNPGPFAFSAQTFTSSVATPRQVDSHHAAFGGSNAPGPASPNILRNLEIDGQNTGSNFETSHNVEAELAVSKAGNYQVGEVGLVGDAIIWTITVANTGTAPANGVQITDNVPAELRVDDALSDNGSIAVRGQTVIFIAESIGVGETVQFQVITTILSQPSSGTFANSVNVVLPDGNGSGSDANLVASGTVESVDGLPATGYRPRFRW